MDCRPVLESIAQLLPSLSESVVEDQLVTFDSLVGVSDPEHLPDAARMLRHAATLCADPQRRERMNRAADAVAAGQPCAFTPEGLSAKEAAAAQTVTQQEWEERIAISPLPPPPEPTPAAWSDDENDEDDEEQLEEFMEEAPPQLPHLPVCHFFRGLIVRSALDFVDAYGRTICTGDLLHLLDVEPNDQGFLLNLIVRTAHLTTAHHAAIIENAGNACLQPVPSKSCLQELWDSIDSVLADTEEDEEMDDHMERIETLRADVDACADWLNRKSDDQPPPDCRSAALAARVFGRDDRMTYWTRLLFAAVRATAPKV